MRLVTNNRVVLHTYCLVLSKNQKGIFPSISELVFGQRSSWYMYYFVLSNPSNLLTQFVCNLTIKLCPNLAIVSLQHKIGLCTFRMVTRMLNKYGTVMPVPVSLLSKCPNLYRLMTTDWTLSGADKHSNVPMYFAVMVFLMSRAELSSRVGSKHRAGKSQHVYSNNFRFDFAHVLAHLAKPGQVKLASNIDEQGDVVEVGLWMLFQPKVHFDLLGSRVYSSSGKKV